MIHRPMSGHAFWLLVGALEAETSPIAARLRALRAVPGWPNPVAQWGTAAGAVRQPVTLVGGELDGVEVRVLTAGVGPMNAEMYTRQALEAMLPQRPRGVLSFGTCGALVDDLRRGDVVTATALFDAERRRCALAPRGRFRHVALTTCAAPVCQPRRRDALAAHGCHVVEMEAGGVLAAAAAVMGAETAAGSFGAVKVVSDQAGAARDEMDFGGVGKAFDRDAFLAVARELCTIALAPVLSTALS